MPTADSDYRDTLRDLGPTELEAIRRMFSTLRDSNAGTDRLGCAIGAGFALLAGIAADAGNESADVLAGIAKATRRRTPTSH